MTEKKIGKELDDFNKLSKEVYKVEREQVVSDKKVVEDKYLVLDTIDTDKDTFGYEHEPRSNSMQAMTVAEIKDEYKSWDEDDLKDIKGYPQSVINQNLTIVYAGTKSWQDWKTNFREIGFNDKHQVGAFQSALTYASQIERQYSPEAG